MKHTLYLLLIAVCFMIDLSVHAQGWEWARGNTGDVIDSWSIATDNKENVYIAGLNYGDSSTSFGSIIIPNGSGKFGLQTIAVKYDSAGNVLWALGTTFGNTSPIAITTDHNGNLYLFGTFNSESMQIGSFKLKNFYDNLYQYFLAKISPSGTVLWAKADGNITGDVSSILINTPGGIACDDSCNVYITSSFGLDTIHIGSDTLTKIGITKGHPQYLAQDIFIAKYDSTGIVKWATRAGGNGISQSKSITVTSSGSIYITGIFSPTEPTLESDTITLNFDSIMLTNYTNSNYGFERQNVFLARYNNTPRAEWAINAGNGTDNTAGLTTDHENNVYLAGSFADSFLVFDNVPLTNPNQWISSLYLFKINPFDKLDWYKIVYGEGAGYYYNIYYPYSIVGAQSIAIDACENVWVSGHMSDSINIDGTTFYAPLGSVDPVFIAGFNGSGNLVGANALTSGSDDRSQIACDIYGNVYLESDNDIIPFIVANDTLDKNDSEYLYVAKYNSGILVNRDTVFKNTNIYITDSLILSGTSGALAYIWNNGDTSHTQTFFDSGTYWVCGIGNCVISTTIDTFHVYLPQDITINAEDCRSAIPGAFTPNGDNKNDIFSPIIQPQCSINSYTFSIFNRWGEMVFTTHDPLTGWDGKYLSSPVDIGVYMYYVEYYTGANNTHHQLKGDVTLIR